MLVAKSKEALEATKREIEVVTRRIKLHLKPFDLGDVQNLSIVCREMFNLADSASHSQFVLIHSAGTMNTFDKPFEEFTDPKEINDYFNVNYTSMTVLTALFLSHFRSGHRCVVNITSILAHIYLPGFPLYTPTRAARNAYMGVLTAEKPDVRTLSYSPGPCVTDMHNSLPKHIKDKLDESITCQQSITKFIGILREDKFDNGALIDYYDVQ